ncbi:Calx-beta domain-containing protein [Saccharothrix deserti]|uniref:Calx-beta domain-containing protein n=1 Tax=Saccharothrix deserti TaxID=2593674 RepID=UPI001EE4338A|nr:Calx-beta domain-containing protein [Saccharothrix deserti]
MTRLRNNAGSVTDAVLDSRPTAQFAVSEYRDAGDAFVFRVNQNLTGDTAAVQNGIDARVAGGGGDIPEAAINALFEIGTGAIAFRPDGTRIVAWFGDAPSHDPSQGHALADAIAALQAADIRVIAVNVGPAGGGLDAGGQATAIVNATGGVLLNNVPPDQVAQAILDGIESVQVTVTPTTTACDPQLTVGFTPATFTVSLDRPSPRPVTVDFTTADGTAVAPADYAPTAGTVTFAPGEITKLVTVPVNGDTVDELNETFTVTLSAAGGAAITDAVGVGTIVDDDHDGEFSCRASALNLVGIEPAVANPANVPCVDDAETVARVDLSAAALSVNAKVLSATTDQTPDDLTSTPPVAGDNATATAKVDTTTISTLGLTIELGVIKSEATARCVPAADWHRSSRAARRSPHSRSTACRRRSDPLRSPSRC